MSATSRTHAVYSRIDRRRLAASLLGGLLAGAAPASAQVEAEVEAPKPPAQLDAFAPMLGAWVGEGTVTPAAGVPPMRWTGTTTVSRELKGFVVQDDMRVDMAVGPLAMRTIYGVDPERGELRAYSLSNAESGPLTVRWLDDATLQAVTHGVTEEGATYIERWTTTHRDGGFDFLMERAQGAGPFFTEVTGRWTRAPEDAARPAFEDAPPMAPVGDLPRLKAMVGAYDVKGTFQPGPEAPAMEVGAREEVSWLFPGSVLMIRAKGEPMDYEGVAYLHWNRRTGSFGHFGASSTGIVGSMEAAFVGDALVFTSAGPAMGLPGAERLVLEFTEEGFTKRSRALRLPGTGEPVETFRASYQRIAAGNAAGAAVRPGSCCAKAADRGETCSHPCCVEAAARGTVCATCNG